MTVRVEQSWCPACKEWTVTDTGKPCVWCDTRTVKNKPTPAPMPAKPKKGPVQSE